MFPGFFKTARMFGRGDFRYVVLDALNKKPMHGYEIMKVIGNKFSGFYSPSPGMVYPTLQMLEDEGHIKSKSLRGKKIYEITKKGKAYLKSNKGTIEAGTKKLEEFFGEERMELMFEIKKLAKLMFLSYEDLSPVQIKKISKIVKQLHQDVRKVIES
jgi:DNA-binding PadR family transcriptional regulator